jgi:hypothetical protein
MLKTESRSPFYGLPNARSFWIFLLVEMEKILAPSHFAS